MDNEMSSEKNNQKEEIPTYTFGAITFKNLEDIVNIKRNIETEVFRNWFEAEIQMSHDDQVFFNDLIKDNYFLIESYNEEELKVKFISPILNRVKFTDVEHEIRDFYEEKITYRTDRFVLTGTTDFLVSKGLEYSKKPYFFIQEFKRTIANDDPRPQLLAELISAVELNGFKVIKGAFIIGENWNFVILDKQENDKYQYFVSHTLNATNHHDLQQIYKNLLFVKHEIIEMEKQLMIDEG
jgi:hypothetical protein